MCTFAFMPACSSYIQTLGTGVHTGPCICQHANVNVNVHMLFYVRFSLYLFALTISAHCILAINVDSWPDPF